MKADVAHDHLELRLFLEAVVGRFGYDFRHYAEASMLRRVRAAMIKRGLASISQLQHAILHEQGMFETLLPELTVTTSEMFRDPSFFRVFREQVIPVLKTFPTVKVWHAGCSTGEEVYSTAILLREEGLEGRAVTYATDINQTALATAREGIYRAEVVRTATRNYQQSGGTQAFSDYYSAAYESVRLDPTLRDNIVFADHNLVTDDVFSEMHVVICRNVLIYFNRELQERVIDLFARSLRYGGVLCLGSKETIRLMDAGNVFDDIDANERIYRKRRL